MGVSRKIEYSNSLGERKSAVVNRFPDTCPVCGKGIEPVIKIAHSDDASSYNSFLQAVFICPREDCKRFFIGYYRDLQGLGLHLIRCGLITYIEKEEFPEIVEKISDKFSSIYNQSFVAEKNRMDQICGPGYRKALEFLIKDYLIKQNSAEKERIIKTNLGKIIEEIKDENIQFCAERAAWLGNDETHYERKWTDKELTHLKELILLTVNWIVNSETTKKYKTDMPEMKKG